MCFAGHNPAGDSLAREGAGRKAGPGRVLAGGFAETTEISHVPGDEKEPGRSGAIS